MTITTVGLDLAKSVFQVHCIDSAGETARIAWAVLARGDVYRVPGLA